MPSLAPYKVDLDTPQPNGGRGEAPRSAFTKGNTVLDLLSGVVDGPYDSTPGQLLKVGYGGLGIRFTLNESRNCNDIPSLMPGRGTWNELIGPDNPNSPGNGEFWYIDQYPYSDAVTQIATPYYATSNSLGVVERTLYEGVWTGWSSSGLRAKAAAAAAQAKADAAMLAAAGALTERGSNSLGSWLRFGDGTQLAFVRQNVSLAGATWTSNTAGLSYLSLGSMSYPVAFVGENPAVLELSYTDSDISGRSAYWSAAPTGVGLTQFASAGYLTAPVSPAPIGGSGVFRATLLGRWK